MDQPLISVIIPVYNAQIHLRQCISSVVGQTYRNLEIILIDDGSSDSSGEICDEFARLDRRIVVVHQENQGVSAARNAGLDICRGELIGFVDSDDWIKPDMYEKMSDMLINKDLDVVFCAANVVKNERVVERRFHYYRDGSVVDPQEIFKACLTDRIGGQLWMKLFRRHCICDVRLPVDRIYEDLAVSHLPFMRAKRPVGFIGEALYYYRLSPDGISFTPLPRKAYYIFQGFLEHFRCAQKYAPEVLEKCLDNVTRHAIIVCDSAIRFPDTDLSAEVEDVDAFLLEYYSQIMMNDITALKWKIAVFMRRYCKGLYNTVFRIRTVVKHG